MGVLYLVCGGRTPQLMRDSLGGAARTSMALEDRSRILVTDRQRALLQLLTDAGVREGGTDADGQAFDDAPPEGMTLMLDMALEAQASAAELVGIMTWGHADLATPETRALAEKIAALRDAPPA